jgi:hypothetical protein
VWWAFVIDLLQRRRAFGKAPRDMARGVAGMIVSHSEIACSRQTIIFAVIPRHPD